MDARKGTIGSEGHPVEGTDVPAARPLQRLLLFGALLCFALPFLTVTCSGETTVSGVQAATSIDISPNDHPGERELVAEESANGFAFLALIATAAALAFAVRVGDRQPAVWAAVVGVIALQGFYAYAYNRTMGNAFPRIGFVAALLLLVVGAWADVGRVPRWVLGTVGALAIVMIPGALLPIDDAYASTSAAIFLPAMLGGFAAVLIAIGAIPEAARSMEPPSTSTAGVRLAIAGFVGTAIVAASIVAAWVFLSVAFEDGPVDAAGAYFFAIVIVAANVAAGISAWAAARAITRPRGHRAIPSAVLGAGASSIASGGGTHG